MVNEIVEAVKAVSVVAGAMLALYAIDAWRREHVGRRRIEVAEEVLALFYQARDIVTSMRHPIGFGGEGRSRQRGSSESPEESEAMDRAFVLVERYNAQSTTFSRLRSLRYQFMAQHGADAAQPFSELDAILNELLVAARKMAFFSSRLGTPRTPAAAEQQAEQVMQNMKTYYSGFDDDPVAPRVDAVVAHAERVCRGIIEGSSTLHGWLNTKIEWRRAAGTRPAPR